MLRTAITAASTAAPGALTALASGLPRASATSGSWMLVFPAGETRGRDGRGPFVAGGVAEMQSAIEATLKRAGATEIVVDYDHQSFFGVKDGVAATAKAAGWVKEWQARADGIWARIEWTEAAAAAIRAGEYRYLSPVFATDKAGRLVDFHSIALTNVPALDLEAIAARAAQETSMEKIIAALGLKSGAGEDAVVAAITALSSRNEAFFKAVGLAGDADEEKLAEALKSFTAAAEDLQLVAAAAGADRNAGAKTIVAAIEAGRKGEGDGDKVITALRTELADTAKELTTLKSSLATKDAAAVVDAAIRDKRVGVKPLRDHYIKRHAASAEGAEQVETELAGLPTLGPSGETVLPPKSAKDGAVALTAEQRTAAKVLGISEKDYAATLKAEAEEASA